MRKRLLIKCILLFITINFGFGQQLDIKFKIDSIVTAKTNKPFNGIILISQDGREIYSRINGYSDFDKKISLKQNDEFVIGSISKQITAVLVLQEYDKGRLKLDVPIHNYLPELKQSWADTVTIHQLLTHTHGIVKLDMPLAFAAGTKYEYSQIGYQLLASIVERTSKETFANLSLEIFEKCGMEHTFHPDLKNHKDLVQAYTAQKDDSVIKETDCFRNNVAAGAFISSVNDLILWNTNLHNGKLLSDNTYQMMVTKQQNAVRDHPLFGKTEYGYGITVDTKDNILQYGQTGFAPGFVSMDFYFPESKTSVVVLENIDWDIETFKYHIQILKIVRDFEKIKKHTANTRYSQ
jgi:D-alanyl-D-alanine carboxypeptidase